MRRGSRSAAAAAALAAAAIPLWPAAASAGGDPPDEFHQSTRTVTVGGVACQVTLTSSRLGPDVFASTHVVTQAPQCATSQVFVNAQFVTPGGETVAASTSDAGPAASVAGAGAADLVRSFHGVTFTSGDSQTWTMASK
jgi:hypothetical protein